MKNFQVMGGNGGNRELRLNNHKFYHADRFSGQKIPAFQ